MPVTIELIVLMLLAYALGVGIGWAYWGNSASNTEASDNVEDKQ